MKITKLLSTFLLLFAVFAVVSCSKDGDPNTDEQPAGQEVPQSKAEAETKLEGKWTLSGSGVVRSIEFASGNTYVLEVPIDDVVRSGTGAGRQPVARASAQRNALVAQTATSSETTFLTGTYTISADGKTITLDDIGIITIKNLTADNFTFSVKFSDDDKVIEVTLSPVAAIDTSDKTAWLVKTWVYRDWPSTFTNEEKEAYMRLGLKLSDMKMTFTKSGTFIQPEFEFWEMQSPVPELGDPEPPKYGFEVLEPLVVNWKWKDSQQNVIIFYAVNPEDGEIESFEAVIETLTANSLKFSTWIGDADSADLVPIQ